MPLTINDMRVEATVNNLGKMPYFSFFDWISIVLDQWPNKDKFEA